MSQPRAGTKSMIFILITVFVDTLGFGVIIPVVPDLIQDLTGEGIGAAARYGGWLMFVFALMQFVFAPVLGNLSDRFGRRPVLLLSLLALGANYLLMGFAPTIGWLFAGRILAGGFAATHATANAYVVDISERDKRAKNFGLIGAIWGIGFTLGPVVGGLLGEFGPRVPFFAAAGLALLNTLYGLFVLPETLAPEQRRPFSLARANVFGAARQLRRYGGITALFASFMLYALAHDSLPATWSYCGIEKFGWTPADIGYSLGVVGLAVMFVQAGLIGPIVARFGERRTAFFGFASMAIGYMGFAYAPTTSMLYVFVIPFALGGVAMPALRSIMTSRVPEDAQGELAGAISGIMSIMAIPAPIFMTQLFDIFTAETAVFYFPGASFLAAGLLMLGAAAIVSGVLRGSDEAPNGTSEAPHTT
ncbi:MAG: TCR/Tet family MFS transporter [bacterium]|nr:TCR/Tet family MFS transporter [bacterium]